MNPEGVSTEMASELPATVVTNEQPVLRTNVSNISEAEASVKSAGGADNANGGEKRHKELVEGERYDVADIIAWLPSLGFDEDTTKFVQKMFRRNAIDGNKLADLDHVELKNMGIEDPKHQQTILQKRPGGIKMVKFRELLRFADRTDMMLMAAGVIGAMGQGALMPLMTTFLGDLMEGLFSQDLATAKESTQKTALVFLYLGIAMFVVGWMAMGFFAMSAVRQGAAVRMAYLKAILRQDQAWFDQTRANQLSTRIAGDVPHWMEAIQHMAKAISSVTTLIAGLTFGFVQGWQLALIILATVPVLGICGAMLGMVFKKMKKGQDAYAQAGGCAEETLGNMRTVASLGAEEELQTKYEGFLAKAYSSAVSQAVVMGAGISVFVFTMFSTYALSLWYGSTLITTEVQNLQTGQVWNGADVLSTFFCILIGAMVGGEIGPVVDALSKGRGAAYRILDTIDRKVPSELDPENEAGLKLEAVRGALEIEHLHFTYPSRPGYAVFQGLSLSLPVGKTVALVGSSGSGKSTVVALLQRFYLPASGRITLDGHDVASLNLRWYRSQIGIVSQEPVLFSCSIKENIAYGNDDATEADIVAASKVANAFDFVSRLPAGFETEITNAQLSGGQKQRVAIARAVVKNPRILLLDEATSALDATSEADVQAALETCMQGRTTLVIAHRLSTVRNADRIVVLNRGELEEEGTYQELSTREGGAFKLLMQQQAGTVDQALVVEQATVVAGPASLVETLPSPKADSAKDAKHERVTSAAAMKGTVAVDEMLPPTEAEVKTWDEKRVLEWADGVQLPGSVFDGKVLKCTLAGVNGRALWGMTALQLEQRCAQHQLDDRLHVQELVSALRKLRQERYPVPIRRVLAYNKDQWYLLALGVFVATLHGGVMPSFAFVFSAMLNIFFLCTPMTEGLATGTVLYGVDCFDPEYLAQNSERCTVKKTCLEFMQGEANLIAGVFALIAVGAALINFTQLTAFTLPGSRLTSKLRARCFASMLRQPIGFFDRKDSSPGALATTLEDDASKVQGATGSGLGLAVQSTMSGVIGLCIAFYYSWKFTLVVLAMVPLLMVAASLQMKAQMGGADETKKEFVKAGAIASEAIGNSRTVAAFNMEDKLLGLFATHVSEVRRASLLRANYTGLGFGFGQGQMFLMYFVAFMVAGEWVASGVISQDEVLKVFFVLVFSAMGAAQASAFAPNLGKAKHAMSLVFSLIDRVSELDHSSPEGETLPACRGDLCFEDVHFAYPQRPHAQVLRGLSFQIAAGQTCALVGGSGGGKSTVIQLLERFYNPLAGRILLDGADIRSLNLAWLRKCFALVSQEPVLFDGSITYNITLGNPGITTEQIEAAARTAYAHQFVTELPDAYDTEVGERGAQLSGGQKQRIAIARALARNPRVLLLDEATSALDSKSEKVVQKALDEARRGRTSLVVAHRLSTIRDADLILAMAEGQVLERGTHPQLMEAGGFYAKLVERQTAA